MQGKLRRQKKVIGGEQTFKREQHKEDKIKREEDNASRAALREHVAERIQNETKKESNARREDMWMEERLQQETEEQQNRRNENTGTIRNAQNRIHRVNNLLFTEANYQRHNCGK